MKGFHNILYEMISYLIIVAGIFLSLKCVFYFKIRIKYAEVELCTFQIKRKGKLQLKCTCTQHTLQTLTTPIVCTIYSYTNDRVGKKKRK